MNIEYWNTATNTEEMQPQVKHSGLPKAGKAKKESWSFRFQREHGTDDNLILDFWPHNCEIISFCCSKPVVCGIPLQQPWEIITCLIKKIGQTIFKN